MKYLSDLSGYFFYTTKTAYTFLYRVISGCFNIISFKVRGVKLGRYNEFYGFSKVSRVPMSSIIIGSNNAFRSDKTSNLIGVNHPCILSTQNKGATIKIGNNSRFSGVSIGASYKVEIGNNVLCGANCVITDHDWHTERYNSAPKPVIIKDNVWLGLNSIILKGVTIGENTIIGANSLVVNDIPSNVIAAGNPCKIIKTLNSDE